MSQRYLLIIILIVLVAGGIFWLLTKQEAPRVEPADEVLNLLENLRQETAIDFSNIADVEFNWLVEKNEEVQGVAIQGKGFEASEILTEPYAEIESFLKDNGFEADVYNAAAGTLSSLAGYRKDYLVCIIIGGVSGYKEATGQWIPPETDKRDVEIRCGQGDSSIDPVISKELAIRRLLAAKYNKKVAEVSINISQEIDNHLRGGVEFQPGGPENSGIFLAVKVNEYWQLVFDGQGTISCKQVENYNFPDEMVADCSKSQTLEIKKADSFSITLVANPTAGYQWQVDFEADYLQLIEQEYIPDSPELVGSGGRETFNFLALKSGQTEITFSYLRPWESKQPIEEKVYQIIIK